MTPGLLVYELTEADLVQALLGPPAEWRENYTIKGAELYSLDNYEVIL